MICLAKWSSTSRELEQLQFNLLSTLRFQEANIALYAVLSHESILTSCVMPRKGACLNFIDLILRDLF